MTKPASLDSLQNNLHWAFQYIGTPWQSGAQGPHAYDCWGFFRHIQLQHFHVAVPVIDVDANNLKASVAAFTQHVERDHWLRAPVPFEGCAVLMAHAKYPSHVGVYLQVDGGGVLHCVRGEGVVFSTLTSLQLAGWSKLEFYAHASHA